jgi:hypothetical protein
MLPFDMTKAARIFKRRFNLKCLSGRLLVVVMDLYRLPDGHPKSFPEGYRFSWIAFDPDEEGARVLFDCHHPKGPHVHLDDDQEGEPIEWTTVDEAYVLFFDTIRERFGDFYQGEGL